MAAQDRRSSGESGARCDKTQNEDGGLGQDDTMESDQDATAYGVWALVMTGYLDGLFYKETCGLIPVERYRT